LIGQLGEMNCLLFCSGNVGKEKKKRRNVNINGCLKKRSTELRERTLRENISENSRDVEDNSRTFKKTTYTRCKIIGRLDMTKR
jgi:hypothetical protein